MYKKDHIKILLKRIEESISLILDKTEKIKCPNDFLINPDGMFLLSGVCMQLIFIGENVKSIDKRTNHQYLIQYPEIPWTEIMGLRDIIAHEYHRIDAEEIFQVVKEDLPLLLDSIRIMSNELFED